MSALAAACSNESASSTIVNSRDDSVKLPLNVYPDSILFNEDGVSGGFMDSRDGHEYKVV